MAAPANLINSESSIPKLEGYIREFEGYIAMLERNIKFKTVAIAVDEARIRRWNAKIDAANDKLSQIEESEDDVTP